MHASHQNLVNRGPQLALRLAGIIAIGMLLLAACSPSSGGASPTATGAVPATGATSAATGTTAATSSATGTTMATSAAAGTMAATSAATTAPTSSSAGGYGSSATATGSATSSATTSASGANSTGAPGASATVPASLALTVKTSSSNGQYLADDKGMTLYVFKKDAPGVSNCSGGCAAIWPPLLVTKGGQVTLTGGGDSTKLGTITRADGNTQVTYNNQPLYYYAKDKAPGDTNGQGIGGVWFVAAP